VAKGIQNRLIFYKKLLEKITKIHKPGSPEFYRAFMRLFDEDGLHDGIPGGAHHRALEYFGLDVSLRPEDRLILNHILCEIVFGELPRGRKRGSGEFWNRRAYMALADLYYEFAYDVDVDEEMGPLTKRNKLTHAEIAELISKTPEFNQYRNSHLEIRKRIPEALRHHAAWAEDIRDEAEAAWREHVRQNPEEE
jgi:hypothetical protein